MILLSDANVLIDIYVVDGFSLVAQLAPMEVLDSVLVEVENRHQKGITDQINAAALTIVPVTNELLLEARTINDRGLSVQDKLNLHYVRKHKRTLLTGDGKLRKLCIAEGTPVAGTFWLIDQVLERQLADARLLCLWLHRLSQLDRFLPADELSKRKKALGCKQAAA
jgi:hypothetical protein